MIHSRRQLEQCYVDAIHWVIDSQKCVLYPHYRGRVNGYFHLGLDVCRYVCQELLLGLT